MVSPIDAAHDSHLGHVHDSDVDVYLNLSVAATSLRVVVLPVYRQSLILTLGYEKGFPFFVVSNGDYGLGLANTPF